MAEGERAYAASGRAPWWARALILAVLLLNLGLVLLFARRTSSSANTDSRLATIECLAHYGTFHIDRSRYVGTIDKVWLNGHFLSTKPPLLSAGAALAYRLFAERTGRTFANDEAGCIYFVSVLTGVLPHMLLLLYFLFTLRLFVSRPEALALGFLALGVSYLGIGYATGISNQVPAALSVMGAFYHAFRTRQSGAAIHHWMLAGLWVGLIPALDVVLAPFAVGFMVYLLAGNWRRTLALALPCSMVPVVSHLVLTHAITGSILPVYGRRELYDYPGSFWKPLLDAKGKPTPEVLKQMGLEGARDPRLVYAFHVVFGHHGFLSMTPVLALGLWQAVLCVRKRCGRLPEALLLLACSSILGIAIISQTRNYGGVCVGLRWMVGAMPLFFLFAAAWLDRRSSRAAMILFLLLTFAGSFHAWDALQDPWKHSRWHQLFRPASQECPVQTSLNGGAP